MYGETRGKAAFVARLSILALAFAACSSSDGKTSDSVASGGTGSSSRPGNADLINLGLLTPLTGSFADAGVNQQAGAQVAVDEINASGGLLGGQKLTLDVKDTGKGPNQSIQAMRDFTAAGTKLLLGELSTSNCLAIAPLIKRQGAAFIIASCSNSALTGQPGQQAPFENVFRIGSTDVFNTAALAQVVATKFPTVTKYDAFVYDYKGGRDLYAAYYTGLGAKGVKAGPGQEFFVPLDSQDYRPQVSALAAGSTDGRGLYLGTFGAGTGTFLQQAKAFDLASKYKVIVNPGEYYSIARTLNGTAPEVYNSYDYSYAAYNTPANQKFVAEFEKATGKKPVTWSYVAYVAVKAYAAAITKSRSTDANAVAAALKGVSFDSPQGAFTLDATTNQGNANIVVTDTIGDPNSPEGIKVLSATMVTAGSG